MDDKEKDFESAFNSAYDFWFPWIAEAHKDFKYYIKDPWTEQDRQKMRDEGRELLHFPVIRRIVKLITGYERRNRLTIKISPAENSDNNVAAQLTGLLMPLMENRGGHTMISDAFEMGALVPGMNLIEPYFDMKGRIQFSRVFYNKFLLDPNFTRRDLSDCGYIIVHMTDMKARDIKQLVPEHDKFIDEVLSGYDSQTSKLPFSGTHSNFDDKTGTLDYFWERTSKKITVIGDRQTGKTFTWKGDDEIRDEFFRRDYQRYTSWTDHKDTVKLTALVNGRKIETYDDPNGIDDYNYTLVSGFYYPEYDEAAEKLQGIVRPLRDSQRELDKRLSKILDIIDSQVSTGIIAEENSLVDKDDIHASGGGRGIWIKEGMFDKVKFKEPGDIPAGLFQLNKDLQGFINQIAGINESMFGTEELKAQISGYLLKLRQGAGLVSLQDLFDNLRFAKKDLAFKTIKMMQSRYTKTEVERTLNEPIDPQFFLEDLSVYDLVPEEGILTSTQQQAFYAELREDKAQGAPIPWKVLYEQRPGAMKKKLLKMIEDAEKAEQQQRKEISEEKRLLDGMRSAKINADNARAGERRTQEEENRAGAMLDRIKAGKEIQGMDYDRALALLDRLVAVDKIEVDRAKNRRSLTKR